MKKQVEVWLNFAEKDLLTVSEIIGKPELSNIVTFHCQQAIEKYFKAFILEYEKPLIKIHNLLTLYGTIKEIVDLGINEDLLAIINDIYLESRYPGSRGDSLEGRGFKPPKPVVVRQDPRPMPQPYSEKSVWPDNGCAQGQDHSGGGCRARVSDGLGMAGLYGGKGRVGHQSAQGHEEK
jgi:HEPN domain-containing protein